MISLNGIRNALWSLLAFSIVAFAATPMPLTRAGIAQSPVDGAGHAQADPATARDNSAGVP
jgi:hypothetical protein